MQMIFFLRHQKVIIIASLVSGVFALAVAILAVLYWRRRNKRKLEKWIAVNVCCFIVVSFYNSFRRLFVKKLP